ncbi:MAG TPA: peptidoglycan DD-metalloendopeptidase family protein [Candidatus Scatomorpha merdavium]|jgi:murein DD-endopeptidase MepM/ murein hydrolase activator NlpD|nr:peptidoglycan DD-metalloendopeptidase family protein [Candidatus Scatomorpha merdavium]
MKKKTVSAICIALAFIMIVTLVVSLMGSFGAFAAGGQEEIDALEQQKQQLQSQQQSIQSNINDLVAQQADVIEQKAAMDEKNELARQEIELINEQIEVYTDLIDDKAKELEAAEKTEQEQLELYKKRVRSMEENGSYTYLDILFQCRSLSDVLSAIDMIGEIMESDKRLYEQYKESRENTERIKGEYEQTLVLLGEKQETLEAEKAELEKQIAAAVEVINQLENDIEAAKAEYAKAAAAEAAAQASINAIIAQMQAEEEAARQEAANNGQDYTGTGSTATGTYIWPCPSCTYVTSKFGMREHPLFGDERPHTGIDIGAQAGAEVIAADSGTVAVATYSSSYGNYVTIYHSNGDYTLYAHMSSLTVTAGQNVTQGDVIGYVGSTGWASGPHLHFEIRVNGSTVDPTSYFSGLSYAPDA